MRRVTTMLAIACGAIALSAGPAIGHQGNGKRHVPVKLTVAACLAKAKANPEAFKEKYGPRPGALRRCVRDNLPRVRAAVAKAAGECRDERELDPAAFAEKYGAGPRDRLAFPRCVGSKLRALAQG